MYLRVLIAFVVFACVASNCKDLLWNCTTLRRLCFLTYIKNYCPATCGSITCVKTTRRPISTKPTKSPSTQSPTLPPTCGTSHIKNHLVIGGDTATRGSWPWQALMIYNGKSQCGGTLLSTEWVLTAAHCVSGKERLASSFTIRVGEHDRNTREGSEKSIRVSSIISHSMYDKPLLSNDIALIKLANPVKLNKYVQPACLPDTPVLPKTECYITGWGKTRHPGSMTSVLQQAKMKVVDRKTCYERNRISIRGVVVDETMVCAGDGGMSRKSGCHGDSGGPFVCNTGGRWYVHGAVSHGSGDCNSKRSYTVFANVSHYHLWIKNIMNRY